MDEDGEGVDGDRDARGLVAELGGEGGDLGGLHLAAHRADLSDPGSEGDRRGARALAFDLDFHVGILGLEAFAPEGHQVVQGVGTHGVEVTRNTGGHGVSRDLRVDGNRVSGLDIDGGRSEGDQREGLEDGVHVVESTDIIPYDCYEPVSEGCFFGDRPSPKNTPFRA